MDDIKLNVINKVQGDDFNTKSKSFKLIILIIINVEIFRDRKYVIMISKFSS